MLLIELIFLENYIKSSKIKLLKMYKLLCPKVELQLKGTLNGGQSFRWKQLVKDGIEKWIGVFNERVWILQEKDDFILYEVYENNKEQSNDSEKYETMLREYFQLDVMNLEEHYALWSSKDLHFKKVAEQIRGVRILQQHPTENIFSFICSQNNNISRISSMVEKLAIFYGDKICDINGVSYHAFPKVEALADAQVEQKLRQNGFGYRAKYICKAAQQIVERGGDKWYEKLKKMDYNDAKNELICLSGIGPKVADCICLMSLKHLHAIPVDTHMYQIAARLYMPKLAKRKSLTEKIYNEIGDHFREIYGPFAGWAQTVLFCADLKKFKNENEECNKESKRQKVS